MATFKGWQSAIFHQIYPRRFAGGKGDNFGDLPGITSRLDHLRDRGTRATWLSPHFPSPFVDCGVNVSDCDGVADQECTPDSLLNFCRRVLALHRAIPALVAGDCCALAPHEILIAEPAP